MIGQVLWTQHAVGHGGFHTGQAVTDGNLPYTWIYDCGSRSLSTLRERLEIWAQTTPDVIDWLYISHFDSDHVNGLEDLFGLKTIHTVMLPFVNDAQLTLALCEIVVKGGPAWLVHLIADPVAWFSARRVRRIIFLGSEDADDADFVEDFGLSEGPEGGWKESITPAPERQTDQSGAAQADVYTIPGNACSIRSSDGHVQLRFEPYRVRAGFSLNLALRRQFIAIAGAIPSGPFGLGAFAHALARKARTGTGRRAIQQAYSAAVGSSNRASMSMVSVLEDGRSPVKPWSLLTRGYRFCQAKIGPVAWASTGDAELLDPRDLRYWRRRYRLDLHKVAVLALPHHGSDRNSDVVFQSLNRTALLTAHVRTGGSTHHPGPLARRFAGTRLHSVTGLERTTVCLAAVVVA